MTILARRVLGFEKYNKDVSYELMKSPAVTFESTTDAAPTLNDLAGDGIIILNDGVTMTLPSPGSEDIGIQFDVYFNDVTPGATKEIVVGGNPEGFLQGVIHSGTDGEDGRVHTGSNAIRLKFTQGGKDLERKGGKLTFTAIDTGKYYVTGHLIPSHGGTTNPFLAA